MLQNRMLKYMTFTKKSLSANSIFKLLKIIIISDLYQLNLAKFMYKYNANTLRSSFDNFFQNYTTYVIMAQGNKFLKISS